MQTVQDIMGVCFHGANFTLHCWLSGRLDFVKKPINQVTTAIFPLHSSF